MTVFLIGPANSTFVKHDIEILSKVHTLRVENTTFLGKGLKAFFRLVGVTIRSCWHVMRSDVMISWFADYYSLIPALFARLLNKRVFVVAGGFDVMFLPEIQGGARANPVRWFFSKNTFRLTTKILPVSHFAHSALTSLLRVRTPIQVIYNGVDVSRFAVQKPKGKRTTILTISQAPDYKEYSWKGIRDFIMLAKVMPDVTFVLAGLRGEALSLAIHDAQGAANLRIIQGPLSLYDDLIPLYHEAAAYCQFSKSETFGVAVVEAMAAGCVPIIYPNGSLPEVTGEFGKVVRSVEEAVAAVRESFLVNESYRQAIANHACKFALDKRAAQLLEVVSNP